jgi:hypothetical protein
LGPEKESGLKAGRPVAYLKSKAVVVVREGKTQAVSSIRLRIKQKKPQRVLQGM